MQTSDALNPAVAEKLPITIGIAFVSAAVVLAGILVLANRADWWNGFAPAAVASALAAGVSLVPLRKGLRQNLMKAVTAYFVAAVLRTVMSLVACVIAVKIGGYPAAPTLLLMLGFYLAILIAETAAIVKALAGTQQSQPGS